LYDFLTPTCSYKAMIDAIRRSQHYIFIENQYFISATLANTPLPRNNIALAILDRCPTSPHSLHLPLDLTLSLSFSQTHTHTHAHFLVSLSR
jgi:hypothetical protein